MQRDLIHAQSELRVIRREHEFEIRRLREQIEDLERQVEEGKPQRNVFGVAR